ATTTVMPLYRGMQPSFERRVDLQVTLGATTRDVALHVAQVSERRRVVFVDVPVLFDRPGLYGTGGQDFPDNADRFATFAAAALDFVLQDEGRAIDIVHAHDWQAGLAPVLVRTIPRYQAPLGGVGLVTTIH